MNSLPFRYPLWMKVGIIAFFLYNLLIGIWLTLGTEHYLAFSGQAEGANLLGWRIFGVITMLWGASGWLLLQDGPKYRWLAWSGIVSSLIAVPMLLFAVISGKLTFPAFAISFPFDLLGLLVLPFISYKIYQYRDKERIRQEVFEEVSQVPELSSYVTNRGTNLAELTSQSPVLLVFLRHFGCTFCRESLEEIGKNRERIERRGTEIVLVHMVGEPEAHPWVEKYGLSGTHQISDPDKKLYEAFELKKGSFGQLFGFRTWIEGFRAGVLKGHGIGKSAGDPNQMPGLFVLRDGKIVQGFRHKYASDRPDYLELAPCTKC